MQKKLRKLLKLSNKYWQTVVSLKKTFLRKKNQLNLKTNPFLWNKIKERTLNNGLVGKLSYNVSSREDLNILVIKHL